MRRREPLAGVDGAAGGVDQTKSDVDRPPRAPEGTNPRAPPLAPHCTRAQRCPPRILRAICRGGSNRSGGHNNMNAIQSGLGDVFPRRRDLLAFSKSVLISSRGSSTSSKATGTSSNSFAKRFKSVAKLIE